MGRARARRFARRAALWSVLAAAVLLGVYFYFAHARGVTPLHVGG